MSSVSFENSDRTNGAQTEYRMSRVRNSILLAEKNLNIYPNTDLLEIYNIIINSVGETVAIILIAILLYYSYFQSPSNHLLLILFLESKFSYKQANFVENATCYYVTVYVN